MGKIGEVLPKILNIPVLLVFIIPLITFLKVNELSGGLFDFWTGQSREFDFFTYYKSVVTMLIGFIAIIILIARLVNKFDSLNSTFLYIPIAVYMLFIILSWLLSKDGNIALKGFVERHEGVFVLLSYMAILIAGINISIKENTIKVIIGFMVITSTIIGIIGLLQFFGFDYLKNDFIKSVLTLNSSLKPGDQIIYRDDIFRISSTLYNSNYVGLYMSMMFPASLCLYLWTKKRKMKVLALFFSILMFANLLGSRSRSSFLSLAFSLVILLFIYRKKIRENIIWIILIVLFSCIVFNLMNSFSKGTMSAQAESLAADMEKLAFKPVNISSISDLKDIYFTDGALNIITSDSRFSMSIFLDKLMFFGRQGEILSPSGNKHNNITFKEKSYADFRLELSSDNTSAKLFYKNIQIADLEFTGDGISIRNNRWMLERKGRTIVGWMFAGKESIASGRGFIWSRSLPLIKDTMLLGHGPDTFAAYFPQYDYVGALKGFGRPGIIVDKPHNLYMQIAINTGVISLLAVLSIFFIYLFQCGRIYNSTNWSNINYLMGSICFVSFCGYIFSAFFNDSVVSVAPVFWALIGIGTGINLKIHKPAN